MEDLESLFVDFDGQQVEIKTNVPEIPEFVRDTFRYMITPQLRSSAGSIIVKLTPEGVSVFGGDDQEIHRADIASAGEFLKNRVLTKFMMARKDLLWLHAGAAETNGSAMIFAAPSGHGKSTMVTLLAERGWRFLSDDVTPLAMSADIVYGYPVKPQRRRGNGDNLTEAEVSGLERESVEIRDAYITRKSIPVGTLIFPRFESGTHARLEAIRPGDGALRMLRNALNFCDHGAAAVGRIAALARTVAAYELVFGDGLDGVGRLETFASEACGKYLMP